MTRFILTGFITAFLLSGCVSQPSDSGKEQQRINELLILAGDAYRTDRLTTPREDNAYSYYQQVIQLDPGNETARHGISDIIEKYLAWARDNAEQGRFSRARQYVARAESIDARHPNIPPVVTFIKERESRIAFSYRLNRSAVAARKSGALPFEEIAERIVQLNAFVTIRAEDDASGRWLYRQLNNRVSFRLQARFEINSMPAIELEPQVH